MKNKIIFGSCQNMQELGANSIHLVVTSPPYFNAPFDYPDLFSSYEEFLKLIRNVAIELKRVLAKGRIAAFVCDDTLIGGYHDHPTKSPSDSKGVDRGVEQS
jgi:DNA modification methylase